MPDEFVFSVKGPRFATNRRVLAEAGKSIERFFNTGVLELGPSSDRCCGSSRRPRNSTRTISARSWNCCPKAGGARVRQVVEVRHDSFCAPAFIALLRSFSIPVVFSEHGNYPAIADVTAP